MRIIAEADAALQSQFTILKFQIEFFMLSIQPITLVNPVNYFLKLGGHVGVYYCLDIAFFKLYFQYFIKIDA